MSESSDPSKRIPKSLGTDARLFGRFTLTDLLVGGMPGVIVILITQIVLPESFAVAGVSVTTLTIPMAILAIGVGGLFVHLTPAYTTSLDWLEQFARFHQSEQELSHDEAKEYTQLEQILPRRNAVVRADGAVVGAVHVDPPTMALATDDEWETKTDAFADFVNTTVDFPIQIYSTTQEFPTDEYLETYEKRLTDPDIKQNETLAALIENYIEWYEDDLNRRRMTIRDHYVLVSVRPEEVQFERNGLMARVADLAFIGTIVRAVTTPPVAEERATMVDELDERLRQIERGLHGIEELSASRINAEELTSVMREFWAGQDLDHGDLSHRIRTTSVISSTIHDP